MINENTLRQWWHVFKNDSELVEIRILGRFQYSGYYKNIDKLIEYLPPKEKKAKSALAALRDDL